MPSTAADQNPLLSWTTAPPFDQITADHVEPAVDAALAAAEERLAALEADCRPDWKALIEPLEALHDGIDRCWGPVGHLMAVRRSDELRQAYEAAQPRIVALANRLGQSRPIYDCLQAWQRRPDYAELPETRRRIIERLALRAEQAGVGLDEAARMRFNEIQTRLAELSTSFSNNVLDATKAWHRDLTSDDEVAGLPPNWRAMAAAAARDDHPEASAEAGPWRLGLDLPSILPFLQHAQRRDLREAAYRALFTRASAAPYDNRPLIDEILALRREKAALLGQPTFAAVSLRAKMADDPAAVRGLLDELLAAARPAAEREFQALQELAAAEGQAGALRHWDLAYWSERLRERTLGFTDEELRPYFSFERVLQALFDVVKELFAIDIRPADGQVPVWHEDVRYFTLHDADGAQVAACYLDPYSRPADKRGGAWMNDCVGRSRVCALAGSPVRLPVAYLACNQTPPLDDTPSLMTFREVETLFHEFGHALQHMLTRVDDGLAAGIAGIEWDAVELPSQFMENWCYHLPILRSLARHWQTDEPLADERIDRLLAARNFQAGLATCRQLLFGLTDLALHEASVAVDADQVLRQVATRTNVLQPLPEDRFLCSFNHIFAGGYAAGYYSYKWAEVLSADAFAAFEEAGLDDAEALRRLGRRFRDTVLACGGGRHPMDVYRDFRGRPPSPQALVRQLGLTSD